MYFKWYELKDWIARDSWRWPTTGPLSQYFPESSVGNRRKFLSEWPVCGPNYESGASRKKSGNIMFCENYWKHTTCKWQYVVRGYFRSEGNVIPWNMWQQFFIFFPHWKLSRMITASSGVCSTFTQQFCGNAHWNLVTWVYILITTIGHTDCPSTVDWSFFSQKCVTKRLGVRKQGYKVSQRLCWSLKSFGLWRRIDW